MNDARGSVRRFVLLLLLGTAAPAALAAAHALTGGIIVGGVTESSARFRIRLDGPDAVSIQVALDSSFASPVTGSGDSARAAGNFAVIVGVGGLAPDTKYYYRPVVGGTPLADSMDEMQKKIMEKNPIVDCPPGIGDPIATAELKSHQRHELNHELREKVSELMERQTAPLSR